MERGNAPVPSNPSRVGFLCGRLCGLFILKDLYLMTILTPSAMTALRNKRNRSCVERAIHDLLLRAWNGDKGYVEVTHVYIAADKNAGYKIHNMNDLIYDILGEYKKAGWNVHADNFHIIFSDAGLG